MQPTLQPGDEILINKYAYLFKMPQIGDIVAVKNPQNDTTLIKRIQKNINGKFFVIGDNKKASTDSRKFGMLERSAILGKLIYKNARPLTINY